jgi:hypothetical protein
MNQKWLALRGLVICAALIGVVGAFVEHSSATLKNTTQIAALGVVVTLIFVWVHHDSAERDYKRSQLLNAGLLIFPLIFVPVYLFLSRNKGQKAPALLGCIGFGALLFITTAVTESLVNIALFLVQ